jgi:hypothetical protein
LILFVLSLGTVWCNVYFFICNALFLVAIVGADDFENLQELNVQDFEQQLAGEQVK